MPEPSVLQMELSLPPPDTIHRYIQHCSISMSCFRLFFCPEVLVEIIIGFPLFALSPNVSINGHNRIPPKVTFGVLALLDSPLFKIYVLGRKAEGELARPFKKQGFMASLSSHTEGLAAKV